MFRKILLPVDLQDKATAHTSLQEASHYLADENSELHVMAVLPGLNMPLVAAYFPNDTMEKALRGLDHELHQLVAGALPGRSHCHEHVCEGNAAREIIRMAEKLSVDLIVMPSHNYTRVENILIGSVTARVVERAHCSVMVLRERKG
ncbi:universal stress protein [Marinobacterium weihaiense]|uniref:Universal stress protein n=1 Tax=Marinobacterium weihaiense TaxID=2851016 RepID=A0ABS6MD84_9GAMM|nr:universal stress protein [Marinobacterium weihaiense]MBV0933829.1 universal stress protein [Marinobacterium weihaiense]